MAKNGKMFIKPGVLNQYDMERKKTIAMNNAKLNALGLKRMATSLVGPNKKGKGKNTSDGRNYLGLRDNDDEDYQPEDEDEEEFSSSDDEDEIIYMASEKQSKFAAPSMSSPRTGIVPLAESTVPLSHTQEEPMPVPESSFSTPGSLNATSSINQAKGDR